MTREDVKKLFPDATDEQITSLLNQNNSEVAKEKNKAEKLKADFDNLKASAANADELQKKIEELEQGQLSEVEKITKQLEQSNQRVAELERSISGQVVKDDGTFDMDLLGQIIAEKETNAVSEYEKKKLAETKNPSGAGGSGSENNNLANDMAIASAKRAGTANETILKNYRR